MVILLLYDNGIEFLPPSMLSNLNATALMDGSFINSGDSAHGYRRHDTGIWQSVGVGGYREVRLNEARCDRRRVPPQAKHGMYACLQHAHTS